MPAEHSRRQQQGVYTSSILATGNLTCKVLLLDTRFNKDPYGAVDGDFLGEEQWRWLEAELADDRPDLVLLGSSIQVLPEGKLIEESWSKFPAVRERLLRQVLESPVPNILLLSGDVHTSEVLKARCGAGRDKLLTEFTTSGLTHTFLESTLEKSKAEGRPRQVVSKGLFKSVVYAMYQWLFPHFYRESSDHHYQGIHFGLIEVVANREGEKRIVITTIDIDGRPVIVDSLPFRQNQRNLSETCSSGPCLSNQSVCEPLWGTIPHWRVLLCICGLSAVPIVSIGGSLCFLATALYALYQRFRGQLRVSR